ncbi:MAG: hypothetical protein ACP5R2_08760 [Anaerolineae bacterium]
MAKKVLLGLLGLLLVGTLVFGAVNRTMALVNYPNTGQRYGQQNADASIHRGRTGQEGTAEQGGGWQALGRGRRQHVAEEGQSDQRFESLRRGQGRGADQPRAGDANSFIPWN